MWIAQFQRTLSITHTSKSGVATKLVLMQWMIKVDRLNWTKIFLLKEIRFIPKTLVYLFQWKLTI